MVDDAIRLKGDNNEQINKWHRVTHMNSFIEELVTRVKSRVYMEYE